MLYKDRVYRDIELNDKLVLDIINSKAFQRLKEINQHAISSFIMPKMDITRFEHCIGVYLLLKKLGADYEEQIAGLLHDISQTAMSHVQDFLFNRENHDYHEEHFERILTESEIPEILEKNNVSSKNILNQEKYTLLENEYPDLCADRVDYFYRDCLMYGLLTKEGVDNSLNNLRIFNNEIVFNDKDSAHFFATAYIKANKEMWSNTMHIFWYNVMAGIMEIGLKHNIITENDFFLTDTLVYNKLKSSNNHEIKERFKLLNTNISLISDKKNFDFHLKPKPRIVDPKIMVNNQLVRLSQLDGKYKEEMDKYKKELEQGYFVRIIK
ncbi:hypothetical protein CMO89_02440 [Candidatus Woesearchaeota archaeon]|nr:hypothetical protein [Candidatus Woesearchaeota archaeon]|tara:strand:- start:2767 stop:3741 length:975 start_codon:yes stop_codon:yes gene_type:complete